MAYHPNKSIVSDTTNGEAVPLEVVAHAAVPTVDVQVPAAIGAALRAAPVDAA